ncbi:hypothetical protein FQ707_13380 [Bacteroidaceae bacterium HV4-6-C5C]|jgi:hypothetical protein|nr:hypothetical protein FQ707_13380 [Bacteroidaceae bacterium HV4-6-C5C]
MNEIKQKAPVTLDEIIQLKKIKKQEIKVQKEILSNQAKEIFSPFKPFTSKSFNLIQTFSTGMVLFDGIILGFKVIKKIKSIFRLSK